MLPSLPILDLLQDCQDPPLTPATLAELQDELGIRFPDEYAEFLLRFNGGYFTRNVEYSVQSPTRFVSGGLLQSFIGEPNDGFESNGFVWNVETLRDRLPPDALAIANSNFNDLVMLKLVGPKSRLEGVWHVDSSPLDGDPQLYWLADSFYEFLSMLVYDVCEDEVAERLPLFQAIERGALTAIEQYLQQGGDVEAHNEQGRTLLMAALIYRWPKLVSLLLQHGAKVNARDEQGRTLHHAAVHSVDGVKLLLAAGADATARDSEGKSVLGEWSYRADQILRKHGASE